MPADLNPIAPQWPPFLESHLRWSSSIFYALAPEAGGVRTLWVSPNVERVLGYTIAEAEQEGWWASHLHPMDADTAKARNATLEHDRRIVHQYRFLKKNGEVLWIEDELFFTPADELTAAHITGSWTDITERRVLESALATKEVQLRAAERLAQLGSWNLRLHPTALSLSEEASRLHGLDPEASGVTLEDLVATVEPEHRDAVTRWFQVLLQGGAPPPIQFEMSHTDGVTRAFVGRGEDTRDDAGAITGAHGTVQDITARVSAERAIVMNEERLRLALRAGRQGLYDLNVQTGRAIVNREYATMLGYDPDTFVETNADWVERLHPDDRERTFAAYRDYVEGRRPEYRVEFRQRTANGDWKWILSLGSIVARDANGEPLRMLGTHTDISEAKATEAVLRLQSAALSAAANAIVITDRTGAIEWANPAFETLTGYPVSDVVGRNPRELLRSGVQATDFYRSLWETILRGEVWRGELVNRRRDGTHYPESLTITPVRGTTGEVEHFIAIKRDLTEERRLQRQLLQSQKMESVGRLAGGVAHDFNNLLTVITGTADLAMLALNERDPLHLDLLEIHRAADRAAALTRQLLAFSRQQVLHREPVDLNRTVTHLVRMLSRLIGEDVQLETQLGELVPPVLADPGQLEQVLVNLVVNARDAMPTGGTLTIRTSTRRLPRTESQQGLTLEPGDYSILSVTDTGTGMSEATKARIFEPFFTTKEIGQGTGLGLATVYGIVQQSGGMIEVESTPGLGSTFTVFLPQTVVDEDPETAGSAQFEPSERAGTILVVDDEPALLLVADRILRRAGYRVLTATSAEEALELAGKNEGTLDLLLTDVVMPGMSGPDLARELLARLPALKVLYTSGYTDDTVLRHGVSADQLQFLNKPYSIDALVRKVRAVLSA